MLPKVSSTGIQVKTAIDEANGTPLLSLAEGTKLAFVLTIQNPSFSSFTALDGPATGHIHVFSNNTKQATLSHSEISKKDVVVDPMTFALVEIQVTKGLFSNLDQAQKFVIHFKAVEHLWKYYLVASPSNNDYHIESSSMNGLEAITFEKALVDNTLVSQDKVAKALLDKFPNHTTYLFTSTHEVPSYANGRKNIQLKRGKNTLIQHLPNPSVSDQGIKILKL